MNSTTARPNRQEEVESSADSAMFSKISWRLVPLLFIAYGVNYVDRVNISYAKLQMSQSLSWSETVYGLGAGIFFVGYMLFEIPSNLMLARVGARLMLLRTMFCWGIVVALTAFVRTPMQFYVARLLLGSLEAGFFPGLILYLTYWYPNARRGRVIATAMAAIPISGILAGPTSGAVLKFMDGVGGYHGWQWLFLLEGIPASVLGIVAYLLLVDRPENANWLTDSEKRKLRERLDNDRVSESRASHGPFRAMLRQPQTWLFALVYFCILGGTYTVLFMLPSVVKSWGIPDLFMVGIYTSFPYVMGAAGQLLLGRSSDYFKERRWHFLTAMFLAAGGLGVVLIAQGHFPLQLTALSVTMFGMLASTVVLFAFVTERLPGEAAAAGIAAISCLGNLGPVFMPMITGALVAHTRDPQSSLYVAMALFAGGGLTLILAVRSPRRSGKVATTA